jgi:hypothetical protein
MLMLIDKGYYDYDFKVQEKVVTAEETALKGEKLQKALTKFGLGCKKKAPKEMGIDELQAYVMKEMKK